MRYGATAQGQALRTQAPVPDDRCQRAYSGMSCHPPPPPRAFYSPTKPSAHCRLGFGLACVPVYMSMFCG